MLCGGDEFGRTQNGNNNAYCQDNEISWLNWQRGEAQTRLLEFTKKLIRLRHEHPVFRRPTFFRGRRVRNSEIKDVMWFNPGGEEMSDEEWASPFVRCLGVLLSGGTEDVVDFQRQPIRDETFLFLVNAHHEPVPFVLPGEENLGWELILDTRDPNGFLAEPRKCASGDDLEVGARTACLLRLVSGRQEQAQRESWKKRHIELPQEDKEAAGNAGEA